jgi:hypothetical protein
MRVRLHEVALGAVSLALALLLWFAVAGQKSAEISLSAPLEFRNLPEGLELVGDAPRAIDVRLRGSPGLVHRLSPGDVYVPVDLSGAGAGTRVVHLASRDLRVPYGVRVAAIQPASLSLALERTVQRTLAVKPFLIGIPAPGFRVAGVAVEPSQLAAIGPETSLKALEDLQTEPVSIEQAQLTFMRDVELHPPDPPIRVVDPRTLRVTIRLERIVGTN